MEVSQIMVTVQNIAIIIFRNRSVNTCNFCVNLLTAPDLHNIIISILFQMNCITGKQQSSKCM